MENKKNVIIILTIVDSLLFVLGMFFWLISFLAVSRCGHAGMIAALFALRRFESLVALTLAAIFAFGVLSFTKKDKGKFKSIRFITKIYLVISLISIIFGIVFVASYYGSTCTGMRVAIKADLSNLRDFGERYKQKVGNYEGFCESEGIRIVYEGIENNKSELICNDRETEWAACAQLDKNKYFCSDSSGKAKTIVGECSGSWGYTQCPSK